MAATCQKYQGLMVLAFWWYPILVSINGVHQYFECTFKMPSLAVTFKDSNSGDFSRGKTESMSMNTICNFKHFVKRTFTRL